MRHVMPKKYLSLFHRFCSKTIIVQQLWFKLKSVSFLVLILTCFVVIEPQILMAKQTDRDVRAIQSGIKDLQNSQESKKRIAAAKLLGYHATPESIAALATAIIADKDPKVRQRVADSLWKLGEKALAAQKSLTKALADPDPGVRVSASWALQNQGIKAEKLIEVRRTVLAGKSSGITNRFWAAKGLISYDQPANLIHPILEYAKARTKSQAAVSALKRLVEKQDRSIILTMTDMVEQYHRGNGLILEGMEQFEPKINNMVPLICRQFSFGDNKLTAAAFALLEKHVDDERQVSFWLPFVKPYTTDPNQNFRMHSIRLIGRAGGLAYDALPELIQIMRFDQKSNLRQDAIDAIASMGDRKKPFPEGIKTGVAEKVVDDFGRIIKSDPDKQMRKSGVRALDKLKTEPKKVVPIFAHAALNDDFFLVRMAALQALAARGKDAESALPDIKKLLNHPDQSTSKNALWAIKAIEEGDNPVDKSLQPTAEVDRKDQQQALASLRTSGATFDERGFMLALSSHNINKVRAYLDSGISVNYHFASVHDKPVLSTVFDTTTMYAMQRKPTPGKVKNLVRLLLNRGADPNITDKRGNTPLMMAAMGCDEELLQMLIDGGADPHAKSKDGLTALEFTISFANNGAEALLKAGARLPVDKVESYKQTYAKNPAALKLIERASAK